MSSGMITVETLCASIEEQAVTSRSLTAEEKIITDNFVELLSNFVLKKIKFGPLMPKRLIATILSQVVGSLLDQISQDLKPLTFKIIAHLTKVFEGKGM